MKIGFDAKRAFHNNTGLGNYSRTLIRGLAACFPAHEYYLFNPKPGEWFHPLPPHAVEVRPTGVIDKRLSSLWRSSWVKKDLQRLGISLYHGLSNEIPVGIRSAAIPSVVTIHDLIFEHFPHQFNRIDVGIYRRKYRYACHHATNIIAISEQTKRDIVALYRVPEEKIHVCYQSCDPVFGQPVADDIKEQIREAWHLPQQYFLSVGSIIERKNLLNICKALLQLGQLDIPLVVIGRGSDYLREVKSFIHKNGLTGQVIFLSEAKANKKYPLHDVRTMAAIYQMSLAMIYPSFFEGFGIPVLEALWSKVPVITSSVSCLPEAGGEGALYVDPSSSDEIASAMQRVAEDGMLRNDMIAKGWEHAQRFSLRACTEAVMQVYLKSLGHE